MLAGPLPLQDRLVCSVAAASCCSCCDAAVLWFLELVIFGVGAVFLVLQLRYSPISCVGLTKALQTRRVIGS